MKKLKSTYTKRAFDNNMTKYIDLSHILEDNMPGFKLKNENGTFTQFTAKINPFLTHEQTRPKYNGECSFEISEITFQTSIGTYIDSPYHRYPEGRDISEIEIEEVILPGVVIDSRGRKAFESIGVEVVPETLDLAKKAVLFNFGWDRYWGSEEYYAYPFISKELIRLLIETDVRLVGVDTINIDNSKDLSRPAHSLFLKNEVFIVENLTNLHKLYSENFRFFAVPLKAKKTASMPIRAFAEIP
jgi:kynurenine formamidase